MASSAAAMVHAAGKNRPLALLPDQARRYPTKRQDRPPKVARLMIAEHALTGHERDHNEGSHSLLYKNRM